MTDSMTGTTDAPEAKCHDPNHTPRWGMVIDINRCVGCQTCTIACKHWNDTLPDVQWRSVIDVEQGTFPDVQRQFMVVGCQHCAEPPCVPVCPTGATKQREDGLVTMDYDVCIGCGYCAVSCPYQARTIAHDIHSYYPDQEVTIQEDAVFDKDRVGVAQKCTFCQDRIEDGLAIGLTPGVDPEATPACSAACIAQAITFGDYNDENSEVSTLVRENPMFQMHEELGTDPQIKYLYTTPAIPGREPEAEDTDDERMSDPANPLVGKLQKFWDWRAAMNWCFGGVSSGFMFWCWLAYLRDLITGDMLRWFNLAGGVLMSIGLFFVFLKIGRKMRFWRAIFRPQTSWMTRELYVVAVLGPAVLAGIVWKHPAAFAVAGIAALIFLLCQAMILYRARGIPVWRHGYMPAMILATGLLEGLGLVYVVTFVMNETQLAIQPILTAGLLLVLINLGLWIAYRRTAKARGVGPLARTVLRETSIPLHLVGHALPFLMLILAFVSPGTALAYIGIAGVGVITGGMFWKFAVIVRASFQQGYAMPKQPQRGSGKRSAPARLQGTPMRPENALGAAE